MPDYPTITCLDDYIFYYSNGGGLAVIPSNQLGEMYAKVDRCRTERLTQYCADGYPDACDAIGESQRAAALRVPDRSFGSLLWESTKERLGSGEAIANTLHEGATTMREAVGGLTDAALSIPKGLLSGAGIEVPTLPDTLGTIKMVAGVGIIAGLVYLFTRFKK